MAQVPLPVAAGAANATSRMSRLLGRGQGGTIAGRVLMALNDDAHAKLAEGRQIALVTGTNGKTSTTRYLTRIVELGLARPVATSPSGANMPPGIAAALATKPKHRDVVLECDEMYLREMVDALDPVVVVMLNLSRDQLHRTGEVRKVAKLWHDFSSRSDGVTFVIDRDDPFLEYAVGSAAKVVRVSFGGRVHPDAATCPQCDRILVWEGPNYACDCGLGSIPADVTYPGDLSGPARNAVLACEAAKLMGAKVPDDIVAEARSEAPDRAITTTIAGRSVKAKLAKNPESWRESLTQVACPNVVLEVNARGIDGLDTSWLWDVDYSALLGRTVVCTGDRRRDVAYRISVQGVATTVAPDRERAVAALPAGEIDLIASYTAFYNISTGTQAG